MRRFELGPIPTRFGAAAAAVMSMQEGSELRLRAAHLSGGSRLNVETSRARVQGEHSRARAGMLSASVVRDARRRAARARCGTRGSRRRVRIRLGLVFVTLGGAARSTAETDTEKPLHRLRDSSAIDWPDRGCPLRVRELLDK